MRHSCDIVRCTQYTRGSAFVSCRIRFRCLDLRPETRSRHARKEPAFKFDRITKITSASLKPCFRLISSKEISSAQASAMMWSILTGEIIALCMSLLRTNSSFGLQMPMDFIWWIWLQVVESAFKRRFCASNSRTSRIVWHNDRTP